MLFNSAQFLVFFPVVTALYFLLPQRWRWAWLLAASCWFYMALVPVYILILAFTILVDYAAGLAIEGAEGPRRKRFLVLSLIANIGVLAFFKYVDFANDNLAALARLLDWNYPLRHLRILLPIGLSFHTFQSMSYTIEVFRGHQRAERHLGIFALYVMFYPQLVAGPIERPQNLLHQLRERHGFDCGRAARGLVLILWGLVKKCVVADRLAPLVDRVYDHPGAGAGNPVLLATVFFAVQIYCDFSGYSDVARGSAEVMGVRLMRNFNSPYLSRSIGEFWTRWHISLSTWFKDYFYVPLGGNRAGPRRWACNIMATFLLSGLWHGANWTFAVWGALNGLYILLARWTEGPRRTLRLDRLPRVRAVLEISATFALTCLAWVFFRANHVSDGFLFARRIAHGLLHPGRGLLKGVSLSETATAFALVVLVQGVEYWQTRTAVLDGLAERPRWQSWSACYALLALLLGLGQFGSRQFIYFQF